VIAFGRILLPLDGSARAEAALRWVDILPAQQIRLLHICDEEGPQSAEAATYLQKMASHLARPDRVIDTRVAFGEAADGIVADAADVDLIVMCTQGEGGGGRLIYGSVADLVARHAPVPTLLLRGRGAPVSTDPVRRVVVPLDGSANAERALPMAAFVARMFQSQVHLVTVNDQPSAGGLPTAGRAANFDAAGAYLERAAESIRAPEIASSTETRSGAPAAELLAVIEPGDLLIMTTHGRGAARRWQIGSVAEKLLRQASAPVVLIRADTP
jgi:nucleotide-binding universal stress UspA family protein